MSEPDTGITGLRLGLWKDVLEKRLAAIRPDCLSADSEEIKDAEMAAVAIGIMEGRGDVEETEIAAVLEKFLKDRATWMTWETTLNGMFRVKLVDGEIRFALGELGHEIAKQNADLFPVLKKK